MQDEAGRTELERQLADALVRVREMIREIDRRDELIADLQHRVEELERACQDGPRQGTVPLDRR